MNSKNRTIENGQISHTSNPRNSLNYPKLPGLGFSNRPSTIGNMNSCNNLGVRQSKQFEPVVNVASMVEKNRAVNIVYGAGSA